MESPSHSIASLFDQLGLDSSEEAIDDFVNKHKTLPAHQELYEADFWTKAQSSFLKEMKDEDADWSAVIDLLDTMLR
mgnify:FL=1